MGTSVVSSRWTAMLKSDGRAKNNENNVDKLLMQPRSSFLSSGLNFVNVSVLAIHFLTMEKGGLKSYYAHRNICK